MIECGTCLAIVSGKFQIGLKVEGDGKLRQLSFGPQRWEEDKAPEFFPSYGDGWIYEPALAAVHHDGNVSTDLRVVSWTSEGDRTVIHLKDAVYPFEVDLHFRAIPNLGVIESWSVIRNGESGTVRLDAYASASADLGDGPLFLTQFHGDWADEANLYEERLGPGLKVLDSKLAVRAHQFRAPWFLVSRGGPASETEGDCFAGSLGWSGSYRFSFEMLPKGGMRAIAGINPFGAAYHLEPGTSLETPRLVWAYSDQGTGELSRNLHTYVRENSLRDGNRVRAVLLNNWEATYFSFDEAKIISLFDGARDLGMELFLLDDGWFGEKHPRDGDWQGLGDWMVDPKKLPNGLGVLPASAMAKGLRFGLWFEPEMVNPKSALFEDHPDWVIRQPNREMELQRSQMILDLSNPEVEAFAYSVLDDVLRANPGITYVKWDCNRYVTQPGSYYLGSGRQSQLSVAYVQALYRIMDRVAAEHPHVEIMMCSGGGGRVDYRAMSCAHEVWPSDMTDPMRRIFIQWGFSYFFPAIAVANHVTRWGERPLKFCFDVAMSGRLGMDVDVDKFSPEEKAYCRSAIATYKSIRETVQLGELYRLESPYAGPRSALMYTHNGQAVAFVYARGGVEAAPLRLRGLSAEQAYNVRELGLENEPATAVTLTGSELMEQGLPIPAMAEFGSHVFAIVPA